MMRNRCFLTVIAALLGQKTVTSFVIPISRSSKLDVSTIQKITPSTLCLSDVPQEKTEKSKESQTTKQQGPGKSSFYSEDIIRRWKDSWWPQPPEDQLTLSGDILSLFLYSFTDHFLQSVYLDGILQSSTSAADAAKTLDPSGMDITVASTPVWLDPAALGPQVSDQVLFLDLQSRVTPHFTPVLDSAGLAGVSLVSCWLLAGYFHRAFHMRNTLDCPTERVIQVTGQTWITSSILMILMACASQHLWGDPMATQSFTMDGDVIAMNPVQQFFSVLSHSDADYIFNSLGVLLTWRFLISFLLGGWRK